MLRRDIPRAHLYYAATARRQEVPLTAELRQETIDTITRVRELIRGGQRPPAIYAPKCKGCSLYRVCLPRGNGVAPGNAEGAYEPTMSTLYITQQDTVLRKVDERLKVTSNGQTLLDIPLIKVSQVLIFGRVMVTPATVATLMDHGVGLCYLSEHGRYVGRLEPQFSKNSLLRVEQWRAAFDEQRKLNIARQCVLGKLANMRVMLLRSNRELERPAHECHRPDEGGRARRREVSGPRCPPRS